MTPKDQRQRILTIPKVLSTAKCVQFIVQTEQFGFQEQQFGYGDRLEIRHRLAYDDSERAGFILGCNRIYAITGMITWIYKDDQIWFAQNQLQRSISGRS